MDLGGKIEEGSCPLALRLGERSFRFPPWGKYRIGSVEDADLLLQDLSVEDIHCEVYPSAHGIRVVDRSGRTFLGGNPVEEVDLSPGMRIFLGRVPLEAVLQEEAGKAYLVHPGKRPPRRRPPSGTGDLSKALRRYQEAKGPTLAEELRVRIRSAPWLTLSLGAHLVILFLLWNLPVFQGKPFLSTPYTAWEARLEDQLPPGANGDSQDPDQASREIPRPEPPSPEPFLETRISPSPLEDPGIYLGLEGGSLAEKVLSAGGMPGKEAKGKGGAVLHPRLTGTAPAFKRKISALRHTGQDVVLVMDATASMTFGLQLARSSLLDILCALAALVPDNRTALVIFKDPLEDPATPLPTPKVRLSRNPWSAMNFLETTNPGGGGKPRESLLSPLRRAFSLFQAGSKRRKVVLLVGDAPGHPDEEKDLRALVRDFHLRAEGTLCTVYTGPPPEKSPFKGEGLKEFQDLARLGGGRCVLMRDRSSTTRDVLALLLGEKKPGNIDRVLENMEKRPSPRVRIARRNLLQSRPGWLLGQLSEDPVPAGVVREILRRPDPALLTLLLGLLERERKPPFPLPGRQAALYILKHALPALPLSPSEILGGFLEKKTLLSLRKSLGG